MVNSLLPFLSTMTPWSVPHVVEAHHATHEIYGNDGTAWPTANKAYYVEIFVPEIYTISQFGWINANVIGGNFDVGIYDANLDLIIKTGSTAQAGDSVIQTVNVADTEIQPGFYYVGISHDTASSRIIRGLATDVTRTTGARLFEQASAFPLPDPAVPVPQTTGFILPVVLLIPPNW